MIQRQLLDSATQILDSDGIIAYVTCSPHLLETKAQVLEFLHKHPEFEIAEASGFLPESVLNKLVLEDGTVQMWTHRDVSDSMFMALLRRK